MYTNLKGADDKGEEASISYKQIIRLLHDFNNTFSEYPGNRTVKELFEAKVQEMENSTALVELDNRGINIRCLTYRELNIKSNQVAKMLIEKGVKHESIVGILTERTIELIIGILAIIKAGGAYLPIDISYPADRVKLLIEDARPDLMLVQEEYECLCTGDTPVFIIPEMSEIEGEAGNLPTLQNYKSLLYIMYTSGSTGTPKGVMVENRNVVRLVKNMNYIEITASDRILQTGAIAFDASTFEIWGALLNGSTLYLTGIENIIWPERLEYIIQEHNITILWLTSALFNQLTEQNPALYRGLKYLLVGGDVLNPRYINAVRSNCPGLKLINGYGPTENTTFSTCFLIDKNYEKDIPIGYPISNSTAYIVDQEGNLLPPNEVGELWVGGDGVARGYLNNEQLTEQKFIVPKFNSQFSGIGTRRGGDRVYKTGDLARWKENGAIEFLGRTDNQVKIRGFRVETGEVEKKLLEHESMKEAVVVPKVDRAGNKYLCAYYTSYHKIDGSELRCFLLKSLPLYMLPTTYLRLDVMPLNRNGKIDRNALPEPVAADSGSIRHPETEAEKFIAGIIQNKLGLSCIGTGEDFFELGFHSLLAVQLMAEIKKSRGIDISFTDVFKYNTVEKLAVRLERAERPCIDYPPLTKAPAGIKIPLTYQQEQVWILRNLSSESRAYNFQCSIRFCGRVDKSMLEKALTEIIRCHEILRTTFMEEEGEPVQIINQPWKAEITEVDLTSLPPEQRGQKAEEEICSELRHNFDIARLPLLKWRLYKLGDEDFMLLQVEHHFIHDGWSVSIFLKELMKLYNAFCSGTEPRLNELDIQYADYAVWQRKLLSGSILDEQLAYWIQKLKNSAERLELPTDNARPVMQSFNGDVIRLELPEILCDDLHLYARENGYTLFIVMYAVFTVLLYGYSGQEDILVGCGVVNRRLKETEAMIGMFVNSLVLRMDMGGNPLFLQLLDRARTIVLEAHDNQDIPVRKVIDALHVKRHTDINPLYQVMFGFHDSPVPDLDFAGAKGEMLERHNGSSKVDINVICIPRRQQRTGRNKSDEDKRLTLMWEYNTDLFRRGTMKGMLEDYILLLEEIVKNSNHKLSELAGMLKYRREIAPCAYTSREHDKDYKAEVLCRQQKIKTAKPRDTLENEISDMWKSLLDIDDFCMEDNFYDLGGHSLSAISLLTMIQKKLGVYIELGIFNQKPTVEQCARLVSKCENSVLANKTLLAGLKADGGGRTLFFVSPPGANVNYRFNALVSCIDSDLDFYGIQPPSIGGEKEKDTTLSEIAEACVNELLLHFHQDSYLLGGLCSGGIIAFEMANQLVKREKRVEKLILVDTVSTFANGNKYSDFDECDWFIWFSHDLGRNLAKYYGGITDEDFSITYAELEGKDYRDKLQYVLECAKKAGVVSTKIGVDELHHAYKYFYDNNMKNTKVLCDYNPGQFSGNTVLLFNSEQRQELEKKAAGWNKVLTGGVQTYYTPGNHDTVLDAPNAGAVWKIISQCIQA